MLLVITVALVTLAALNAILTAWATVLDARHASALMRALGANSRQVSSGLAAAQVLFALPEAILGVPLGVGLLKVAAARSSSEVPVLVPVAPAGPPVRAAAPAARQRAGRLSVTFPAAGLPLPGVPSCDPDTSLFRKQ
jgi:putative ABC transport system permease protein